MRLPATFPIRDDLRSGESGHGYALRMATANALNALPAVKAMLEKTRFAVLGADDAVALSRWFGGNPERLALALGRTGTGSEPDAYELGGMALTRSYFVNRSQPRVCGECLASDGYCRLAWEVSAMTTCAKHGTTLLARCANCGQALRWDRPHLLQCRCGWILHRTHIADQPALEEVEISRWIARIFGEDLSEAPITALGRLLAPLSLDAGLHILSALASVRLEEREGAIGIPRELRRRNSMASAREAIAHAARALNEFGKGLQRKWRIPITTIELLAEACASSYGAADRQLAMSLLAGLRCKPSTANWSGRFPQTSQLMLF